MADPQYWATDYFAPGYWADDYWTGLPQDDSASGGWWFSFDQKREEREKLAKLEAKEKRKKERLRKEKLRIQRMEARKQERMKSKEQGKTELIDQERSSELNRLRRLRK